MLSPCDIDLLQHKPLANANNPSDYSLFIVDVYNTLVVIGFK